MNSVMGGDWGMDLDLSDNDISGGLPRLTDGVYDVESTEYEFKKSSSGGQMLVVTFVDFEGRGKTTFNFNVKNASAEAQRIGREQLKTFLTYGGHPNPDKPSDVPKSAMIGLKVRIVVTADGTYVKDNKTFNSYKVARFMKIDDRPAPGPSSQPSAVAGAARSSFANGKTPSLSDDIPF
jgi:hypothetical protein